MQRTAALVESWRAQARNGVLARPIEAQGLGPRPTDDALLVDDQGRTAGSLLGGVVNEQVVAAGRQLLGESSLGHVLVDTEVAFDDATAVGLTCGGQVNVLVQRLADIPVQLWDEIAAGRPAALITRIGDGAGMLVVRPGAAAVGSLGMSGLDTLAEAEAEPRPAQRLCRRGRGRAHDRRKVRRRATDLPSHRDRYVPR